jgi:signal transduction histidine kinase
MLVLVSLLTFTLVFDNHIKYLDNQMNNNIEEYLEIDIEQLCNITQCKNVIDLKNNKEYKMNNRRHLKFVAFIDRKLIKLRTNMYVTKEYEIIIYNEKSNYYYILDTDNIFSEYLNLIIASVPLALFLYIFILLFSLKKEKEEALLIMAGSEALLANKSMINITENIHHELNTPLEVIDNKIEKINRIVTNFLTEEYERTKNIDNLPSDRVKRNKKLLKLNEDFDFIKTSSEQIYAVLEKMKGFKHLRYSNGNKTIKDIFEGGFKIINISNTNFNYNIDSTLENYKIKSNILKNADLLSILLNHIKNSLEANASNIILLVREFSNEHIYIRIIDDGCGIPEKFKKSIFNPNFSTKKTLGGIRGNGMYLNKHILNQADGDIKLISSSNKGTTLELKLPAIPAGTK